MDVVARVLGDERAWPSSELEDTLTGEVSRQRMMDALGTSFDSEEVVVLRGVRCAAAVRLDGPDARMHSPGRWHVRRCRWSAITRPMTTAW
jgi:hypothetical protein